VPELPEVETTRRGLAPVLEGHVIRRVEVRRDRMVRHHERPTDAVDRLVGRRVRRLDRHGKFILGAVEGDLTLVLHLGMSGRMQIASPEEPEAAHTNVVVATDATEVRFVDPRTFGFMAVYTPEELEASSLARLGPDALTALPRSSWIVAVLAGRSAPIKALLLDQRLLAGLGNIYADEVLFRARIAPERPGGSLTSDEVRLLRRSVRPALQAGLRWGGTSLDDLAYLLPDGRAGDFARRLKVYGREDEPCRRCGTPIRRSVVRARSSFWCPSCQV
jgi:formamidopyrimidine-DNA glycosylase